MLESKLPLIGIGLAQVIATGDYDDGDYDDGDYDDDDDD